MSDDRVPLHKREITLQGFKRADGLYDIEGHLRDTKSYDRASHGVHVKAGDPVHEMMLRITIGTDCVIRDAQALPVVVPYVGHCDTIAPKYALLKGMKLAPGFMREIRGLFGATLGCTHLTECCDGRVSDDERRDQCERHHEAVSTGRLSRAED